MSTGAAARSAVRRARRRRSRVLLVGAAVLLSAPASACSSGGDYRFDVDSVRPLGDQCPKLRVALTNLILGIDSQEAATLISTLADDDVIKSDVQLLVATNGNTAGLQKSDALQAAEDIRQWIGLSCEPLASPTATATG